MASFNLGRIKGDKGDKGLKGDTGLKGEKGEKGDTGERGTDGYTPIFSVGKTVTASSSEEASVDIDITDPKNPVLNFSIPRGKDGRDALGDMLSAVYDTTGIKQDIFLYIQNLLEKYLKRDGGQLSGSLKAFETSLEEGCLRNISIASSLPQGGANGDICIITDDPNSKKLGECIPGDIMLIEENSETIPYLVAALDYHKSGGVTLVRKDVPRYKMCFDNRSRGDYNLSDIDMLLEAIYQNGYSNSIKEALFSVPLGDNIYRRCFLLSYKEFNEIEYFSDAERRIACYEGNQSAVNYLTRGLNYADNVYIVKSTGEFITDSQTLKSYFRPAIVLPADLNVVNCEYGGAPAVKLPEMKCAMYVMNEGEWKECM